MSGITNKSGSATSRRKRVIKVAPMTRAVRMAMAASLAALALGASGGAFAAGCKAPSMEIMPCTPAAAPVLDLTLVHEAAPPAGHAAFFMPLAISETDIGDVVIDNADPISEVNFYYNATAIGGYSYYGSVDITNQATGTLEAVSLYGNGTGIEGYAYGNVGIDNAGEIFALSVYANGIGIYGYSIEGDVSIDNSGDVGAMSFYGVADGIFASGVNVDVSNSGTIEAESVYGGWAAGIEAQGTDLTAVTNDGSINAYAIYGQAFGIYATGDSVEVANNGDINAQGYVSTGIEAQGGSSVTVTNDGDIVAGSISTYYNPYTYSTNVYGSLLATGINATSNYEDGAITITNNGDVSAVGYYGGTGIAATATGTGGSAGVTNNGSIYASQYSKYGYGAYGVSVSADGDASINNAAGGSIEVYSSGTATGASALSFAGDASVTNAGDISVENTAILYFGAYGIVSFGQNGTAYVGNSGNIDVTSKYIGVGIDASGLEGATVDNSGDISVDAWRAYGIRADSGAGDVSVDNSGSIYATYSGGYFTGTAFGILASSTQGDVSVDNSGYIYTSVTGQSAGIFGVSSYGDVGVSNSGVINAYSYASYASGIFARADYGTTSVDNSGSISAEAKYGYAFGVLARGEYTEVGNSGDISANGYYSASGITASSYYGTTVTTTGGSIYAIAVGQANGISATSFYGDVSVSNASDIDAIGLVFGATGINGYAYGNVGIDNSGDIYAGSLYGNAIGIYGYSIAGDVSIGNSGDITAISYYGLADGIFASGANVDVANSGAVEVYGYTWAAGIEAQGTDSATVTNSGDINVTAPGFVQVYAYSYYYGYGGVVGQAPGSHAYGIYATGGDGGVAVSNSGSITVDAGYATGIEVQSYGDVAVNNSGGIVAGSGLSESSYYNPYTYTAYFYSYGTQSALGINASSSGAGAMVSVTNSGDVGAYGIFQTAGINASSNGEGGSVLVDNSGGIVAEGYFNAYGISATATGTGGTVGVTNSGSIYASQGTKYGYGAYGVFASADGDASIDNTSTGSITVYSPGAAAGATAFSFAGDASVTNAGDIEVSSGAQKYYGASGIVAFAQNGDAIASNSGSVSAVSGNTARAIDASGFTGATVVNSGSLYANGKYAYGVYAASGTGDVSVTNSATGMIEAYSYLGSGFGVLGIATLGDVMVDNAGSIEVYAYGQSAGVFALAQAGDAMVSNSGSITAITGGDAAVGIFARADYGTASVHNSGDIVASDAGINGYIGDLAYGVIARGEYADVSNSGSIIADGFYYATGIAASSFYGTTIATSASSDIEASALLVAIGIEGRSEYGDVSVVNAGSIAADGVYGGAVGIQAYSGYGNVSVTNTGHVVAESEYGTAIGVTGYSVLDNVAITNSNMIDATGYYGAYGIAAQAYLGDVTVTNSGHVTATSPDTARGILATAYYGDITINNSGDVMAVADGDYADAAAVEMGSLYGTATLNNSGTLHVDAPLEGQVAVLGSDGVEVINNTGHIHGSLVLLGGNDRLNNNNHGVWHVENYSTDFGDGNDSIVNNAGGLIDIAYGAIYMGADNDSIVNNAGGLIAMSYGAIYMGAGSDSILNLGVISVEGDNLIDLGSTSSGDVLTNVNSINFLGNSTYDALTIVGNLGGTGALSLDVDLADHSSDQIQVNGNMAAGAAQHVDILFDGLPAVAHTSIDFAHVTGTSVAGNFVPGQILSYNYPRNFIDLQFSIGSSINTANTAADVFSINLDVAGLLDSGTLAANVASGAAGMMNAQIGTLRQRLGANPYGDAGKVMSAFVRFYSSEGDVSPEHVAANFGQGGNFNHDLSTWGREVGVNANLFEGFHAGVTLGSADGRQRLTGAGIGQNRMDGMTWGAYATWFAPQGFYVDLSGRWMAVDVDSMSAAGTLQSRAHTAATNLEAGYIWTTASGFVITPQLQYTQTKVDGVKTIFGDRADFEGHGGTSSRGRLGVEFSKSFQTSGGMSITPYGSINAIREFDGEMNYTVADNFFGNTSTEGTSSMLDLGIGLQKGGWGLTAGANWVDGGALNSVVGGQVVVRFAW